VKPEAAGGIALLRPVPLQELRLRADAMTWPVAQKLADLDSLTPVRGQVSARHHGSVLEVEGEAETIVTLCCDRCLQHFNRPLQASVHELLELGGGDEAEGADLTALAGSAAGKGATGARSRPTGSGAGASGASAPGGRAAGRPPAGGRDRGRQDAEASSGLSPSQSPDPRLAPSPGSQPRRGSRTRSNPEPLLIEVLDDRLDPRGDFDPERWLFEQLSLELPVVNRCGADCPGPPLAPGAANPASSSPIDVTSPDGIEAGVLNSEPPNDREPDREPKPPVDPRWAALRRLLP
jgi:uncharacterized metal-binding protein YceD (DUF177 family)